MPKQTAYAHGAFSWVDLSAHDAAAARKFYEAMFGWRTVDQDTQGGPPYAIFELDGLQTAGLGECPPELKAQGVPPLWNSYINVDSVEATAGRVAELGGTVAMPPMQVLDYGWTAYIQDPTGATVGLWQKNTHLGAGLVNEPGAFCWNELATRDMEQAQQFFSALLGWEFEAAPNSPAPYAVIRNNGRMNGGIMKMDDSCGEMAPNWSVYFTVEDIDAALAKLKQLGGNTLMGVFDVGDVGRMAVVSDPQGAVFDLIQLNNPPE